MNFQTNLYFLQNLSGKLIGKSFKSAKEVEKFQISIIFIPKPD